MKESSLLEAVPYDNNNMSIISRESGMEIMRYRVLPYSSFMLNAELASVFMEAYEKYFRSVQKRVNSY